MRRSRTGQLGALGFAAVWLMFVANAGCDLLKSKAKKPFGEECASDADCESLECAAYGSICTKSCTYDKDCGGSLVCRAKDVGSGNQCSKPTGTEPNGSCNSSRDCQHGICLKKEGETNAAGVCSKYCEAVGDCPGTMKLCEAVSGGAIKMCLPFDETAPAAARPVFVAPKAAAAAKPATSASTAATASAAAAASAAADAGAKPAANDGGAPTDAGIAAAADAAAPSDAGATAATDAGLKPRPSILITPSAPTMTAKPAIPIRPPEKKP